jgi:hypothetical protein
LTQTGSEFGEEIPQTLKFDVVVFREMVLGEGFPTCMREPEYCDDKRLERRLAAVLVVSGGRKQIISD